ncbi:transcriptional regulator [Streptomyces olivaceus]|nr:transcriptional regulator [Streptomyces olivaceus]
MHRVPDRTRYRNRLPSSLDELTGPERGTVELPLHVAWSGLRAFDLDQLRQRLGLYRTVLAEGMREDLCRFLNRDSLLELWPLLRRFISRAIKEVWEEAFPELRP